MIVTKRLRPHRQTSCRSSVVNHSDPLTSTADSAARYQHVQAHASLAA